MALATIADGFGSEAVVIARRDCVGEPPIVSSRVPPSWADSSGTTFELFGKLWSILEGGEIPDSSRIGSSYVWLGCQTVGGRRLVAAVTRNHPFTDNEAQVLHRLIRSVAMAAGDDAPANPVGNVVSLEVDTTNQGWRSDLWLEISGARHRGWATAETPELSVAKAAASACGIESGVTFAGCTQLEGVWVNLVVVNDGDQNPLVGFAVSPPGDHSGMADAVLSAIALFAYPLGPDS